MDVLRRLRVKVDGFARGQTMAEYVLLVSAVAVAVYAGYTSTGTTIKALVNTVNTQM